MKLVIDIPESMYEGVMIDRVLDTTVIRILDEIKNGTPLDDIKTEILVRAENVKSVRTDGHCFFTANEIFEIIDKHIERKVIE